MFIQEFYSNIHAINISVLQFTMVFRGTRIVVTPKLIFYVLCVPRVAHSNYPSAPHFHSLFRDELALHFCEKPMLWGYTLNFTTHDFPKGPRVLNIVMAFVLTLRSHYNTINEPHACFLLSLLDDLSIDSPSHMIDIY